MSKIKRAIALYTENNELEFKLTETQYKIIKQLIRMQLADLIENDASDSKITEFTFMDVSLSTQYDEMMALINTEDVDDELPF
jgi:hypothetical protein